MVEYGSTNSEKSEGQGKCHVIVLRLLGKHCPEPVSVPQCCPGHGPVTGNDTVNFATFYACRNKIM